MTTSSSPGSWGAAITTAVAPVAWGTTYVVTAHLLPDGRPLFAAVTRALPAGLILLAVSRQLPHGRWWWRALVLGLLNFAAFFPLLFLSAYRLPGGVASTVQAASPLVVMALAWLVLREIPGRLRVLGGIVGLVGVGLLVLRSTSSIDTLGLLAAGGSVLSSALGFVLVRRWPAPVDTLTLVSWQLVVGGVALVPLTLVVEGPPPALDLSAVGGLLWLAGVGTVLAYACWFRGLARLTAGTVSLIGLLNPVVATSLGIVVSGEPFGAVTIVGMSLIAAGVLLGQPALVNRRRATRDRVPPLPCAGDDGHAAAAHVPAATPATRAA
ncbi:ABC transporter permease [Nocardioides sp. Root122]|uniref:EamA family transporter n=1 Tax=Nocardioides TaxID=1839 RepID=UPI0007026313|nr:MULTISPECIES: EamA family transporter [Nocardioides]KQV69603.1 ABC transporter permease [Nocardioides sp. Root122]MCK9824469.1 EamA family transporter [Nocardioides cavernae]